MSANEIKKNTEQKMTKSIESLKSNLQKIRTGRAHPGILEQINVDYYGNPTPLAQVANLGLADARTLTVQPWEKNMMGAVEKAIRGMLPKNTLGRDQLAKLKVYRGAEHPHVAQAPKPYTIGQVAQ